MAGNIQLKSNDGTLFEVDRSVIRLSTTLNTMFQGNLIYHPHEVKIDTIVMDKAIKCWIIFSLLDLGMDSPDAGEQLNDPIPLQVGQTFAIFDEIFKVAWSSS